MSDPLVLIDYEFHFKSGDPVFITVRSADDALDIEPDTIRIRGYDADGTIQEHASFTRSELRCWRWTRRTQTE